MSSWSVVSPFLLIKYCRLCFLFMNFSFFFPLFCRSLPQRANISGYVSIPGCRFEETQLVALSRVLLLGPYTIYNKLITKVYNKGMKGLGQTIGMWISLLLGGIKRKKNLAAADTVVKNFAVILLRLGVWAVWDVARATGNTCSPSRSIRKTKL